MAGVRVDVDGGVGVLTIDEPERRNALTLEVVNQITDALGRLEGDDGVGAIVVTGAPPAFCAGASLDRLGGGGRDGEDSRAAGMKAIYEGFLRVARSPLPTIAAVNGAAVGAGMNLALACDVRIAGRSAKYDTRFLQLGLHPGGGHTWMLQRAVGQQTAFAMAIFGEVLDGEASAACGLSWRCVDDDALLESSIALARRAADAPRALTRRLKETLRAMSTVDGHDEAVDLELEAQLWSLEQPEFAERLRAMQERISGRG